MSQLQKQNKTKGPEIICFSTEFYKTFTEELTQIRLNLFHKEKKRRNSGYFYEAIIILITKEHQESTKKREIQTCFPDDH